MYEENNPEDFEAPSEEEEDNHPTSPELHVSSESEQSEYHSDSAETNSADPDLEGHEATSEKRIPEIINLENYVQRERGNLVIDFIS